MYSEYMEMIIQSMVDAYQPLMDEFIASVPDWLVPVAGVLGAVIIVGKVLQVVHMVVDYVGTRSDMAADRRSGELW